MELEEFVEQYKLRNRQPAGNAGRREYECKLERLEHFFLQLQREGSTENMSIDEARLCIRFYDEGYDTGIFWESAIPRI